MKKNSCLISVWIFLGIVMAADFAQARWKLRCDALSGLAQVGGNIASIQKKMEPKVTVETSLEEVDNSYGFFNFPVFDEGTPRLKEICPNFIAMSFEDKKKFWKNFWNQLANYESSGEMAKNEDAHQGAACGYLQLHCELEKRELSVKVDFRHHCGGEIYFNPKKIEKRPLTSPLTAGANNFKCGMAMLQNQVDNSNEIFPDKNKQDKVYWMPLRRPQQMYQAICTYKGCGNTSDVCKELLRKREQELK